MMYGKLFAQMYDGTLATKGPWQALVTFQQLVILADKHGCIDMTPEAIARRTTVPLEVVQVGLRALAEPDPDSRSPAEGGRRIVPIDPKRTWGWRVVNYGHYRKIRSEDERREYHRNYMRSRRSGVKSPVKESTGGEQSQPIAVSRKQEAVKISTPDGVGAAGDAGPPAAAALTRVPKLPDCPHEQLIALYHELLPTCPRVREWTDQRKALLRSRWREKAKPNGSTQGYATVEAGLQWWGRYFTWVGESRFLTGRANGRGDKPPFVADLEWLVRPTNFARVIEGRYHDAAA
jgi:hypothetical protein